MRRCKRRRCIFIHENNELCRSLPSFYLTLYLTLNSDVTAVVSVPHANKIHCDVCGTVKHYLVQFIMIHMNLFVSEVSM